MCKTRRTHFKFILLLIMVICLHLGSSYAQVLGIGKRNNLTRSSRSKTNKVRQQWKIFRWDASFGIGVSNYLGDVGGGAQEGSHYTRDINMEATRWAISAGIRYRLTEIFAVRSNLTFGYIYGDDKYSEDFFRNNRNLSFRSPIFEWNTTFEIGVNTEQLGHRYNLIGVYGERAYAVNPYIFGGLGLFYFNPQALYHGAWVDLQPLNTEGQGLPEYPTRHPYSRIQLCFPIGMGFRYNFDRQWGVGIEYGFRVTFTDYLDDVSQTYVDQDVLKERKGDMTADLSDRSVLKHPIITAPGEERGNPNYADSYMFAIISVHYKLYKGPYVKSRLLWF